MDFAERYSYAILQLYVAGSTAVNSVRASLGEIHAKDSAQMEEELAGAILASYGSHNFKKSPRPIVLGRHRLAGSLYLILR